VFIEDRFVKCKEPSSVKCVTLCYCSLIAICYIFFPVAVSLSPTVQFLAWKLSYYKYFSSQFFWCLSNYMEFWTFCRFSLVKVVRPLLTSAA